MKVQLFLVACLLAATSAANIGGRMKRDSFDCLSEWQSKTTQGLQDFSGALSTASAQREATTIVQQRFNAAYPSSTASTNKAECVSRFQQSGTFQQVVLALTEEGAKITTRGGCIGISFGRRRRSAGSDMSRADCLREWNTNTTRWMSDFKQFTLSAQGTTQAATEVTRLFNALSGSIDVSTEQKCTAQFGIEHTMSTVLLKLLEGSQQTRRFCLGFGWGRK